MLGPYKNLMVWQQAILLATEIYKLTSTFPKSEVYGLASQIRRAAVSIPSNIAEGYQRKSDGYIKNFLNMARGSNAELETQLLLCIRLGYISKTEAQKALQLTEELSKMLSGFINKLSNSVR